MTAPEQLERLCEVLHDAYEAAAAQEGWSTQAASRRAWADVPPANQRTMRRAVMALLEAVDADESRTPLAELQAAIERFDRRVAQHDDAPSRLVTGWAIGYGTARFVPDPDDETVIADANGMRYALGATTPVALALGLSRYVQLVMEKAITDADDEP